MPRLLSVRDVKRAMRKIELTLESGSETGLGEEVRRLSSNAPGKNIRKNKQNPSQTAIIVLTIQKRKIHIYEKERNGLFWGRHWPNQIFFYLSINLDSLQ